MNKQELIESVAQSTNLSKAASQKVIQGFMKTVSKTLANGEDVVLVGFGGFSAVQKAKRNGLNPKTGEKIVIPARKAVKFRPGKPLRNAIEGYEVQQNKKHI